MRQFVCLSRTERPPEREKERKKINPYYKKVVSWELFLWQRDRNLYDAENEFLP